MCDLSCSMGERDPNPIFFLVLNPVIFLTPRLPYPRLPRPPPPASSFLTAGRATRATPLCPPYANPNQKTSSNSSPPISGQGNQMSSTARSGYPAASLTVGRTTTTVELLPLLKSSAIEPWKT